MHNSFDSPAPLNESWFGGSALAVAYTSDIDTVSPHDFTVISTNLTSPWVRETGYEIPTMPECPEGGCLCTWNWLHQSNHGEGYPFEIVRAAVCAS